MKKILILSFISTFLFGCATGQNSSVNIGNGQCKIEDFQKEDNNSE